MCFTIQRKNRTVKIANKAIPCYKVLESNERSNIIGFQYNLKKTSTYKVDEFGFKYGKTKIYEGFHSYTNKKKAENEMIYGPRKIVKFLIPKGTKYFLNETTEQYCSLALKYVKPRPKTVKPVTKKAKPSKTKPKKRK